MRTVDEVFDKYETDLFTGDMAMIETRNQAKLALKELVESKKKADGYFEINNMKPNIVYSGGEWSKERIRGYNQAISQIAEMFGEELKPDKIVRKG